MMENKKKKFGITVCSSEKIDMYERYSNFAITSIPYPGISVSCNIICGVYSQINRGGVFSRV